MFEGMRHAKPLHVYHEEYIDWLQHGLVWKFKHSRTKEAAESGGLCPVSHGYWPPQYRTDLLELCLKMAANNVKNPHYPDHVLLVPPRRGYCYLQTQEQLLPIFQLLLLPCTPLSQPFLDHANPAGPLQTLHFYAWFLHYHDIFYFK